ncbi:Platelet-Derived Growth Factor Receptor-Like Protein [Manis pentadactyla]|nr:Platelet-Derived Growth Factor Receptor-Like Protein [Manis pentadactyla]
MVSFQTSSSQHYLAIDNFSTWCYQMLFKEPQMEGMGRYLPEEVPVNGTDVFFDVKKVFTIHWPQASLAHSVFCLASLGGVRQISTRSIFLPQVHHPSFSNISAAGKGLQFTLHGSG